MSIIESEEEDPCLDIVEDSDAKYDQDKIDEAFPPHAASFPPFIQTLEQPTSRPPLVLQSVTINFSNGRTGQFTGAAVMTVEEFRGGGLTLRPTSFDFTEPFVVASEPEGSPAPSGVVPCGVAAEAGE